MPAGITFEDLFYDPFDQMMRLQLLASAMERAHENADIVSVLHVAPKANGDLIDRITSPRLGEGLPGLNIHEIQKALVVPDRFKGLLMEDLLPIVVSHAPDNAWAKYLDLRYGDVA